MNNKEQTEEKSCMTCLYLVTKDKCDGCLRTEEDYVIIRANMAANIEMHRNMIFGQEKKDPPFRYLNWTEGNGLERGYQFEKEGKLNIVIGGMGEAEVNVIIPVEKTLENLLDVAEQCGYYVCKGMWNDKEKHIEVDNPGGHFRVVFMPDNNGQFKLNRIERVSRNNRAIVIWD